MAKNKNNKEVVEDVEEKEITSPEVSTEGSEVSEDTSALEQNQETEVKPDTPEIPQPVVKKRRLLHDCGG